MQVLISPLAPDRLLDNSSDLSIYRDLVLVEDNVVGEANVVDPLHGVARLNGDGSRVEDQGAPVTAQLHGGGLGAKSERKAGSANARSLSPAAEKQV